MKGIWRNKGVPCRRGNARPQPSAYSLGRSGITVNHVKRRCKHPPPEEHPTAFCSRETHHTAEHGEGDTLENKQKASMRCGLHPSGSNSPLTHACVLVIHQLPCSWKGDQMTAESVLPTERQVHIEENCSGICPPRNGYHVPPRSTALWSSTGADAISMHLVRIVYFSGLFYFSRVTTAIFIFSNS